MAARVAAALEKDVPGIRAEIVRGGFLELSVSIDGRKTIRANGLFTPPASHLIEGVKSALNGG
ncbi:MAG: hypothetical protein ACREAA_11220 [Candidatus Polarisedimenticolia bacterium]